MEGKPRSKREPLIRQGHRQRGALNERDEQTPVSRVLRDLAAARLTFFAQLLQGGIHHGHEIHDDAGSNIGHHAQRKDAHALQRATREHVEQIENAALLLIEQRSQTIWVDTGHRNVRARPVDEQRHQHEQQPAAQLREPRLYAC